MMLDWRFVMVALCAAACSAVNAPDDPVEPGASGGSGNAQPGDCANGVKDGAESDVDCGGGCTPCALGAACASASDCESGFCPADDGVCCNAACDALCMACAGAKTRAADGTCAAVLAGSDADGECAASDPSTCGVGGVGCNGDPAAPGCLLHPAGTVCAAPSCAGGQSAEAGACDGSGVCQPGASVACSPYACNAQGTACNTNCGGPGDCATGANCSNGMCVLGLDVGLTAGATSCATMPGQAFDRLRAILQMRGHTVSFVTGSQISTLAAISAFDVIVLTGPGDSCTAPEFATYDAVIGQYVMGGGGLVGSGWLLYSSYLDPAPNIAAMMPTARASNYLSNGGTVQPIGTHPIVQGVASFAWLDYLPWGGGTKAGATTILQSMNADVGAAWQQGNGRAVFLGPLFVESYSYLNEGLLDGSQPSAIEVMARAVEWAGGAL